MSRTDPTVCFVVPTRDRPDDLGRTLAGVGRLDVRGEVLVIDNGSRTPPLVPRSLPNGLDVSLDLLAFNEGAASRNRVIGRTDADWVVMLDDDSHPVGGGLLDALRGAPDHAGAVSADIRLPNAGTREMGGLPEVFIGCGVAIRREVFERLGGYDASFGYYAEEYDLSARLLLDGYSVRFDPRFRVEHFKSLGGRDMGLIVERLVRNNAWVMQRYAPEPERRAQIRETRRRCRSIAEREGALAGYARGLIELRRTIGVQARRAMPRALFDRFTGLAAAREALRRAHDESAFASACVVEPGKNAWCVERALDELGVRRVERDDAEAWVIGTMSPGPMLDTADRLGGGGTGRRVIAPWVGAGTRQAPHAEAV